MLKGNWLKGGRMSRRLRSIGAIKTDKKKPSSTAVDLASQIFPGNFEVPIIQSYKLFSLIFILFRKC